MYFFKCQRNNFFLIISQWYSVSTLTPFMICISANSTLSNAPWSWGQEFESYVQCNTPLKQAAQLCTPVNITQNEDLQILLSTMNTSIYIFIHSSLGLPSLSSFSVLSGEQNIALQRKFTERNFKVSNLLLVKLAASLH